MNDRAQNTQPDPNAGQADEPKAIQAMDSYMGCKMVSACRDDEINDSGPDELGYRVVYADGYESWSPKDIFERAYMKVFPANSVNWDMVRDFISDIEVTKAGEKTTVVRATLANGFEIVEASSCVDPTNYDELMARSICIERIETQVWKLLGFLLQQCIHGSRPAVDLEAGQAADPTATATDEQPTACPCCRRPAAAR